MNLDNRVDIILEHIVTSFGNSSEIVKRTVTIGKQKIAYIYLESVSSDDKISNFFMKDVSEYVKNKKKSFFDTLFNSLENSIPNSHLTTVTTYEDIYYFLSSGYTAIFVDNENKGIVIETKSQLDRGVTESSSEAIIRGPKDSFTENNATNLGLIRKRIKDPNLWFDETIVGRRTKTKITIAYIQDIADNNHVDTIKQKLQAIDVDGILDSGYIREFILKNNKSAFPQFKSTERPDLACTALLDGKIIILVENSPFVLITPGLLMDYIHSPEDNYQKPINVNFTRTLRFLAFILTIVTPAFYISVTTFNQQMIPNELLISLALQREGVPFPTAFEIILLIITFEILRESDVRIPNAMGAAISIVGALVLGDAAVSAGIISPIVVIIVAITAISGLLYTDIDFVNATRFWRFFFIFASMIAGLVGFVIASIIFITKLCSLEVGDVPYLTPISPFYYHDQFNFIFRKSKDKVKYRPKFLSEKNQKRMGGNS